MCLQLSHTHTDTHTTHHTPHTHTHTPQGSQHRRLSGALRRTHKHTHTHTHTTGCRVDDTWSRMTHCNSHMTDRHMAHGTQHTRHTAHDSWHMNNVQRSLGGKIGITFQRWSLEEPADARSAYPAFVCKLEPNGSALTSGMQVVVECVLCICRMWSFSLAHFLT
jgi:hypothetical protein